MKAQLYVVEQVKDTFTIYSKEEDKVVYTANSLYGAVDYCYHAGFNFEVEIMEQMLLDDEEPQEME